MEILDVDMEMVRDFLNKAGAPEYVKGHFENLLSEYEEADTTREELKTLQTSHITLEADLEQANEHIESLQNEVDERVLEQEQALLTIKYAFLDTMVHRLPMRRPTELLRIVEEALLT